MNYKTATFGAPALPLRRRIEAGLHRALYWSGYASVCAKARNSHGAIILMYHSVPAADLAPCIDPANALPPAVFDRQMEFLSRRRQVLSMDDLLSAVRNDRPIARGSVVLTFDDGYLDNLLVAAPILQKYRLPATLYLPTTYITTGENQWVDELYMAFTNRTKNKLQWDGKTFDLSHRQTMRTAYKTIVAELRGAAYARRRIILDEVRNQLGAAKCQVRLMMNWDDVRTMARKYPLFSLGVHTADHLDLTAHSGESKSQIRQCIETLRAETGIEARHFSFPYGRSNAQTRQWISEAGLASAVVAGGNPLIDQNADPFALPRVAAMRSETMFRFKTSGAYPLRRTRAGSRK